MTNDKRLTAGRASAAVTAVLLFAGLLVPACAPVISREFRQSAAGISFSDILRDPGAYTGENIVVGGYILETINARTETRVVVLEAPLDSLGEPLSRDRSRGRFVLRSRRFLDPEVFRPGRAITVGGTLTGVRPETLGEDIYDYPVIEPVEIYLRPPVSYVPYDPWWGYPPYFPGHYYGPPWYPWW